METLITILREVRDPRDFNARHECSAMLFIYFFMVSMSCFLTSSSENIALDRSLHGEPPQALAGYRSTGADSVRQRDHA